MSEQENEGLAGESPRRHFTTRWGFVLALGFAVISLYFVWAAYDAAPTSFKFLSDAQAVGASGAVRGGHGAGPGVGRGGSSSGPIGAGAATCS